MNPPESIEVRKDRNFLACLLLVPVAAFIGLHFPHLSACGRSLKVARAGTARALLCQLELATRAYEHDYNRLPSGDGTGTAGLVRCLAEHRKPRCGYFEFPREELSPGEDLPNPVDADKIVYYRCPGLHKEFDLWCEDADGRPDGINNWSE